MNGSKTVRKIVLSASALLWIGVAVWLGFLFRFERNYQRTFFARLRSHLRIPQYSPPSLVGYREEKALVWYSFWEPEAGFRWTLGRHAAVLFRLTPEAAKSARVLRFDTECTLGPQPVNVIVNDKPVGGITVDGAGTFRMAIPAGMLLAGANCIEFLLPRASTPPDHPDDQRVLAVGFKDFGLETGSQARSLLPVLPLPRNTAGVSARFDHGLSQSSWKASLRQL